MSKNSLGTEGTQDEAGHFFGYTMAEEAQKRKQLQLLKADLNILQDRIYGKDGKGGQEAQDEELMHHRDQVVQYIKDVEKEIQEKYGAQGGRRKKHRRTKRHSKSRRSKSRRSKSRRSKH